MRNSLLLLSFALGLMLSALGCSSVSVTVDPIPTSIIIELNSSAETNSEQLWGFWDVAFDPQAGRFDVTPLRGSAFQANVTKFLQPPASPIHLITVAVDAGESDFPAGLVVCDVTIRHPFMGVAKWRGFNVRGTVMGNATTAGMGDSGERWPSLNELRVLNADGYARWWNPTEFTTFNKIFGYTEGGKAPAGFYASGTINGYKYFADGLSPEAPLSSMDLSQRGSFSTDPGLNTRRYEL